MPLVALVGLGASLPFERAHAFNKPVLARAYPANCFAGRWMRIPDFASVASDGPIACEWLP
jgi:hypothetical protein